MHSLLFPTTVVDNFLTDPHEYVNLANSLEFFSDPQGRWPGLRTENLVEKYPNMVHRLVEKIMSIYYNFDNESLNWNVISCFQKVNSSYVEGWVHGDETVLSSIIYLCDSGFGTSLYKPKDISKFESIINREQKFDSYKNPEKILEYTSHRIENNSQFEKSLTVDSQFNRMFCFEGGNFHGVDNFRNPENNFERLTLVLFITHVTPSKSFPIQRVKFK